jgi:hypothetical protein
MSQAIVQANPPNHPVIAMAVTSIHKPTTSLCRKRMGSILRAELEGSAAGTH